MFTTLNQIREHSPCTEGWTKLLKFLGKSKADDQPLSIRIILESNGIDDALWCLMAVKNQDKALRLYAVWCARQVQHLMTDSRSIDVLDIAEKYANGSATTAELDAAANAARDAANAAWDAANAAWAAANAAAWDAASAAANAAWAAANAAAWGAASAAANAARDAASAATWAAARDAAANAARDAAMDAANAASDAQEKELISICFEIEANT